MNLSQDPYSTHQPLLIQATLKTTGPILELGVGCYSTPLLHALADGKRSILSLDQSRRWLAKFRYLDDDWHSVRQTIAYSATARALLTASCRFGLCLVDFAPQQLRGSVVALLLPLVEVFVCHDVEASEGNECGWRAGDVSRFRYAKRDNRYPQTGVFSNSIDVSQWPEV